MKMLLFPVPQKFNSFDTFNTFDRDAAFHRPEHSAVGETASRQVRHDETGPIRDGRRRAAVAGAGRADYRCRDYGADAR
jgi:hypothetical protein